MHDATRVKVAETADDLLCVRHGGGLLERPELIEHLFDGPTAHVFGKDAERVPLVRVGCMGAGEG